MSTLDPAEVTMQAYDRTAQRYFQRWHDVNPLVAHKQTLCDALPPDGRLLDVGCGTGRDLLWFRHPRGERPRAGPIVRHARARRFLHIAW